MTKQLYFTALMLVGLTSRPALAQRLDSTFRAPTSLYAPGYVYALGPAQADGKRVVAGAFTRVNGAAGSSRLLRLDANGAVDADFRQRVGAANGIFRVKGLANGQYLLGGTGNTIVAGGLTRQEVLRLNADGSADASFNAGTGAALANGDGYGQDYLPQSDGKVLVTGRFDSFNGVAVGGIVRLNATGRVDASFRTGTGIGLPSDAVTYGTALAAQADGKVLLGGTFSTFDGQPAYGLVRLGTDGRPDPGFTSALAANSRVFSVVVQPDGKILLEGFLKTNTLSVSLLRLNADGSLDASFASNQPGLFLSERDPLLLVQPDGKLLLVRYYSATKTSQVARLNADGSLDASFGPTVSFNSSTYTLGLEADGRVVVGGSFGYFGSTETPLGRLNADGSLDAGFAPKLQIPANITTVVRQPDGQLLLGGTFTEYNGVAVHRVVRVSANGVLDTDFAAASGVLPGAVNALAVQADGRVVAGTSAGVVQLLGTGQPDGSFTPFSSFNVAALAVQPDGRVVAGGSIGLANGTYVGLVRLTTAGSLDATFARQSTAEVGTATTTDAVLVQADGRIVASGRFAVAGQPSAYRVVRYESTGVLDASFRNTSAVLATGHSSTTPTVLALAQQPDGRLLLGGNFSFANGSPQQGVARLNTDGSPDPAFNATAPLDGLVYSLALQPNGRVLLGGSFGAPRPNLTRVLADGSPDASLAATASPNGTLRTVLVQPDGGIVVGGFFSTIGGQPVAGLARLLLPNVLAVAAPALATTRLAAWPVPARQVLHVAPDASARPQAAELLDALGRVVRQQGLAGPGEFTIATAGLPAGVYVLRVRYAAGTVARQVAVE